MLDPVNERKEDLDQTIIQLITTDKVKDTFEREAGLPKENSFFHRFLTEGFQDKTHKKSNYTLLINLFTRWHYFKTNQQNEVLGNQIYQKYLQSLYYFNSEATPESAPYQQLYKDIKEAIYRWNGNAFQADMVNVFIGHKQDTYKISQRLKLKPKVHPRDISVPQKNLKKFKDIITLYYGVEGNPEESLEISIDYELYQLLQKVIKGYRPNKLDKSNHINFVHIVDKIIGLNSQNTPLIFHENNGKSKNGYRLSKDDFGKYQFEKI
ncbi:DNA phosphorothioation-dependent restriction protein DptF [Microscilla marina]|uniref:Uncharacterized protein n=1 Tax=Microscilla marina ATCC 23134 TaxID=313606 RepID=A1ZIK5_MICM2|nr:DNA phosphorothioation-dependent restriction protein DptF [Microscilla marina]EAY29873.1 conserved hypothetical protein [Microscilla marina ATCC 23134]